VSCDPSGMMAGVNLYQYSGDSPLSSIDPRGLEAVPPPSVNGVETPQLGGTITGTGQGGVTSGATPPDPPGFHVPVVSTIRFKGSRPSPPEGSSSRGIYAADRRRAAELLKDYPNPNIKFDIDHMRPHVTTPPGSEQEFRLRPSSASENPLLLPHSSTNRGEAGQARNQAALNRQQPDWRDPNSPNYARAVAPRPPPPTQVDVVTQRLQVNTRQNADAQAMGQVRTSIMAGGSLVTGMALGWTALMAGGAALVSEGAASTVTELTQVGARLRVAAEETAPRIRVALQEAGPRFRVAAEGLESAAKTEALQVQEALEEGAREAAHAAMRLLSR
jgi:hypothetical protein